MKWTEEELREMARADAEIEASFALTAEEREASRLRDAEALGRDPEKRSPPRVRTERQRENDRAYRKAYYAANKERIKAYKRQWYLENKARLDKKAVAWQKANRDKVNAYARSAYRKRRERKKKEEETHGTEK